MNPPHGRFSALGWLLRRNPQEARQRMVDAVVTAEGRVNVAAHVLGVSRMAFWGWCYDFDLWRTINEERIKRVEREGARRQRLKALEGRVAKKAAAIAGLEALVARKPKTEPKRKRGVRVQGGKRA